MATKHIVITGGGTGGHIYPALAVAHALRSELEWSVCYAGNADGMEARLAAREGYPFVSIPAKGLVGKRPLQKVGALLSLVRGVGAARKMLQDQRPDLVFATGGYVSLPVMLAARLGSIPVVIHEQNAFPGLANRIGGLFAEKICLTFSDAGAHFWRKNHLVTTGLPVRSAFFEKGDTTPSAERKRILFTGGSQGSRAVNDAVLGVLEPLLRDGWTVVVLCGANDYDRVRTRAAGLLDGPLGSKLELMGFSHDMPRLMRQADLVVGRAGASFLSEMNAVGRPGVLVPFPHAAGNHQLFNARAQERAGAAIVIEQHELTPERLLQAIEGVQGDACVRMREASRAFAHPNATRRIVAQLEQTGRTG